MRFWEMLRQAIAEPLGIRAKAIAGVELAFLDIKAKALGISVVELFGGPTRDKVRLYWSHCGTTRALYPEMGTPPIRTMAVHFYILAREGISMEMAYGTGATLILLVLGIILIANWLLNRYIRHRA